MKCSNVTSPTFRIITRKILRLCSPVSFFPPTIPPNPPRRQTNEHSSLFFTFLPLSLPGGKKVDFREWNDYLFSWQTSSIWNSKETVLIKKSQTNKKSTTDVSKIHTPRYNKYYDLKNIVYKAWGDLMEIDTTGAAPGTSHADGQKVTGEEGKEKKEEGESWRSRQISLNFDHLYARLQYQAVHSWNTFDSSIIKCSLLRVHLQLQRWFFTCSHPELHPIRLKLAFVVCLLKTLNFPCSRVVLASIFPSF